MKHYIGIVILVSSIFLFFSCTPQICVEKLDNSNGTSLEPILYNAIEFLKVIEENQVEIVRLEVDILKEKAPRYTFRNLYKGWKYMIIAIGDYRISNIKIEVYTTNKKKRTLIAQSDNTFNNKKSVMIEPQLEVEEYEIVIESLEGDGHYALLIAH